VAEAEAEAKVTVPVKGDFICKTCAKKLKPKQAQQFILLVSFHCVFDETPYRMLFSAATGKRR
jgi:hypothetical protein